MQITEYFSSIKDPRREQGRIHPLSTVFGLTILAVICGVIGWEHISFFGRLKRKELSEILDFSNGVPSHDTLERVFSTINPESFQCCFIAWTQSLYKAKGLVSFDGKALRNSYGANKEAIYLVNAWANKNKLVLGQFKTQGKGHEIAGIKGLLDILDLKGSVVSIDAIGCQKDIAKKIIEKEADYILAVKDNQEKLRNSITSSFAIMKPTDMHETTEKNNGRIEKRKCSVLTNLKMIDQKHEWEQSKSIVQIEATRIAAGIKQEQVRYYISSLNTSAESFNELVRGHWGIENSLHWVLDVVYNEDKSRKRKGYSAQNFSMVKKMALNLLNQEKKSNLSPTHKRLKATYDWEYLKTLINSGA